MFKVLWLKLTMAQTDRWQSPVGLGLTPTCDGQSFLSLPLGSIGLPLRPHPGAFGAQRKHHVHEGVDLYVPEGTLVYAVESGRVTKVAPFTGPAAGLPWWLDTYAVWVEGHTGVVLYGELLPVVEPGDWVNAGDRIGSVTPVLRVDKGRPMAMLHLELHTAGSTEAPQWLCADKKPEVLRDPTEHLRTCCANGRPVGA